MAPPPKPERSEEQMTLPEASVVSLPPLPEAEQLKAERRKVEPVTWRAEVVAFVALKFVAKRFVVVAEEPVAFWKVKFWKVEEPVARMLARVARALAWKVEVMIEPAMTVILGALLGWVMLSVLGPIYDSISKIKF